MARVSKQRRPYVRSRRSGNDANTNGAPAGRLSSIAGLAAKPSVEALEPRKLLFSLFIDPDNAGLTSFEDLGGGLGRATAVMGYFLPYLNTDEDLGTSDFDDVDEDFDGVMDVPTTLNANGTLLDSGVYIEAFGANGVIFEQLDMMGEADGNAVRLDFTTGAADEYVAFSVREDDMMGNLLTYVNNLMRITAENLTGSVTATAFLRGRAVTGPMSTATLAAPGNFQIGAEDDTSIVFDEVRFTGTAGSSVTLDATPDPMSMGDDATLSMFQQPPGNAVDLVESRLAGAFVSIVGPIGASVTFFDLYGRPFISTVNDTATGELLDDQTVTANTDGVYISPTISLGEFGVGNVTLGDLDDDGIPGVATRVDDPANDGIGRVVLQGFDADLLGDPARADRFSLFMTGGRIESFDLSSPPPDNAFRVSPDGFAYFLPETFVGDYDNFEDAGSGIFGFFDDSGEFVATGFGDEVGSVILGSPVQRAINPATGELADVFDSVTGGQQAFLDNYDPFGFANGIGFNDTFEAVDFNNSDQGISYLNTFTVTETLDGLAAGAIGASLDATGAATAGPLTTFFRSQTVIGLYDGNGGTLTADGAGNIGVTLGTGADDDFISISRLENADQTVVDAEVMGGGDGFNTRLQQSQFTLQAASFVGTVDVQLLLNGTLLDEYAGVSAGGIFTVRSLAGGNGTGAEPGSLVFDEIRITAGGGIASFSLAGVIFQSQQSALFGESSIHGAVFGVSNFESSLGRYYAATQGGSIFVEGDLGSVYIAGDAGVFFFDPDELGNANIAGISYLPSVDTDSDLIVRRTLGSFTTGGRNLMAITVDGRVSTPAQNPPNEVLVYNEHEAVYGVDPNDDFDEADQLFFVQSDFQRGELATLFDNLGASYRAPFIGNSTYRNDGYLAAEFVGGATSAVVINGTLGARDVVFTNPDYVDVFAFATDGGEVQLEVSSDSVLSYKVVDYRGRTVAAVENGGLGDRSGTAMSFVPNAPGVYYLVVTANGTPPPSTTITSAYSVLINNIAPTNFGSYRTGLGWDTGNDQRRLDDNGDFARASITVADGSLGLVREATGFIAGDGSQVFLDTNGGAGVASGLAINTDQHLFAYFAGDDVNGTSGAQFDSRVDLVVNANLGMFGSGLLGTHDDFDPNTSQGDVSNLVLDIGGSIGLIDITGAINIDQDAAPNTAISGSPVRFRTGMNGGTGDIGSILVGSHVFLSDFDPGDLSPPDFLIDTSMAQEARIGYFIANYGENAALPFVDGLASNLFTNVGVGSDIRFLDTTEVQIADANNASQPIGNGLVYTGVDDGGGRITISLSGDTATGRVIQVPVEGSAGVAIARIEVDLSGGGVLTITSSADSVEDDVISIGRIVITDADEDSTINIQGSAEIDVYLIEQTGGSAMSSIANRTAGGDLIAVDVVGLNDLLVTDGNLGRTERPDWGPQLIGPFLGTNGAAENALGAPLLVTQGAFNGSQITDFNYNGSQFRPIADSIFQPGNAYADDTGFPLDGFLDGLVVRTGSISSVIVGRAIGDVITQDVASEITLIRANNLGSTPEGEFYGIVGNIYSFNNIVEVDVGDGLARRGSNPMVDVGIFAQGNLGTVRATRISGSFIHGLVFAGGGFADGNQINGNTGIDQILVNSNGGGIRNAVISTGQFDDFWEGLQDGPETFNGTIRNVNVIGGDLALSTITGFDITQVSIVNGDWDANVLSARGEITGFIQADAFRNSTIDTREADDGTVSLATAPREFRFSSITVAENATTIRTNGSLGDMSDLAINISGSLTGGIFAQTLTRVSVNVPGTIAQIAVTEDILATDVVAGQLNLVSAARGVASSEFTVSGPLLNFTATDFIRNTAILVSGPDGRIDNIFAGNEMIDMLITSSGPVGFIRTGTGDIAGRIVTTTSRGTVNTIDAAGDLLIDTDFSRTVANLTAGGDLGSVGTDDVIIVRGALTNITAGGQIFSEVRVTRNITGVITVNSAGAVLPADQISTALITSFGFINAVEVTGDFGGTIRSDSSGINRVEITDGSLTATGRIIANDGTLDLLQITNGNLLGSVFAERNIIRIQVDSDTGVNTGDIGQNAATTGSATTAAFDGPKIFAGRNIGQILVTNGSIFEAFIYARQTITLINVSEDITRDLLTPGQSETAANAANIIAAGSRIESLIVGRNLLDTLIIAGVTSFGEDSVFNFLSDTFDRAGGFTLETFDEVGQGRIDSIQVGANAQRVKVSAGVNAGADGVYNTADDTLALGFSQVGDITVDGSVASFSVFTDRRRTDASVGGLTTMQEFIGGMPGVTNATISAVNAVANSVAGNRIRFGGDLPSADARLLQVDPSTIGGAVEIMAGTTTEFVDAFGQSFRVTFTNPGGVSGASEVWWDAASNRLLLFNTRSDQDILVERLDGVGGSPLATGALRDFLIVSNDDSFLNSLEVVGALTGNSLILIDAYVETMDLGDVRDATEVTVGADIIELTLGDVTPNLITDLFPTISARFVRVFISGAFGLPDTTTQPQRGTVATLDLLATGSVRIDGGFSGLINVERSIDGAFTVTGDMERALFRAGGSTGAFSAASVSESRFSVGDNLASINVTGDVFDTSFQAGGDLGANVNNGTTASPDTRGNTDRATTGVIGGVFIGGTFLESDLVAGYLRGDDGFFGTSDDLLGGGVSTIGQTTIVGNQVGSDLDSESFTIAAVGNLEFIGIGGAAAENTGNFTVGPFSGISTALEVVDVRVGVREANIYAAEITFNQAIDASTLAAALSVVDERGAGTADDIQLFLNTDPASMGNFYSIEYDPETFVASVVFSTAITTRDLANSATNAAPGVYRFDIDSSIIRGSIKSVQLEEDFSGWDFVGDVGDRLNATSVVTPRAIDFYSAAQFDAFIDTFVNGGSFTIRGQIGDHPDENALDFDNGADIDAYSIELQAGDIVTLGQISGNANEANIVIIPNPNFAFMEAEQIRLVGTGPQSFGGGGLVDNTQPELQFLVLESGRYDIVVGANDESAIYDNSGGNEVNVNTNPTPREVGDYSFELSLFRDFDTGFNGSGDASDGTQLLELADFVGAASISTTSEMGVVSAFTYERISGEGTADVFDDVYRGRFLQREAGVDGILFTADDTFGFELEGNTEIFAHVVTRTDDNGTQFRDVVHTINSAIGERGQRGSVEDLFFDIDVFQLNNGQSIIAGSEITVTLKQSEIGTDLNSLVASTRFQFGLFDTTSSMTMSDARLVFAPTDLIGRSLTSDLTIGDSFLSSYGYDANGDFFVSFRVPPAQDDARDGLVDGSFAFYVQGPVQSDYTLEITQALPPDADGDSLTGADDRLNFVTDTSRAQRVLIETNGGRVDWLQVAGIENQFGAFDASSLGFAGTLGDGVRDVTEFITDELVTRLDAIFSGPVGGGGAGYNVIFSTDPNAPGFEFSDFSTVFLTSTNSPFGFNSGAGSAETQLAPKAFGYAEHSDPLNADQNDEAVIFATNFINEVGAPTDAELDSFLDELTATVANRVGELLGLRLPDTSLGFSLADADGGIFGGSADNFVQDFQLGVQNSGRLLDLIVSQP